MNRKHFVICLLFGVWIAFDAGPGAADLTPAFTFQGVLTDGGAPAQGAYDLRLTLFDLANGGSQIGPVLTLEDQPVSDGRCTVVLDFGPVFDMTALWIEVAVREGSSTGTFDVLQPRVQLTAAPQAWYAVTSGDADTLAGQPPGHYLDWNNLSGVPPDIADGDDDTLAGLGCVADRIARWSGSEWLCDEDRMLTFTSTYIVGPVGNALQNGAALLNAIGALPPGAAAVYIEAGNYDMGGTALELPAHAHLAGVPGETTITSGICNYPVLDQPYTATVVLNQYTSLRDLEIRNSCDDPTASAVAVLNPSTAGALLDEVVVRAWASAGVCTGLHSLGNLTVKGGGAIGNCGASGTDYGIVLDENGTLGDVELTGCWGAATYGGAGILVADAGVVLRQVRAAAAAGGVGLEIAADGVTVEGSSVEGVIASISVTGGNRVNISDTSFSGTISIDGSQTYVVLNGITPNPNYLTVDGLDVTGDATVEVMSSKLGNIGVGPGDALIGGSRIGHVTVAAGGAATCAGVWNAAFTFFPDACP